MWPFSLFLFKQRRQAISFLSFSFRHGLQVLELFGEQLVAQVIRRPLLVSQQLPVAADVEKVLGVS